MYWIILISSKVFNHQYMNIGMFDSRVLSRFYRKRVNKYYTWVTSPLNEHRHDNVSIVIRAHRAYEAGT